MPDFIKAHNHGTLPLFVYFNKEPPGRIHDIAYKINRKYFDVFDITYTYRRDAVITSAYGKVIPKQESTDNNDLLQNKSVPKWKSFLPDKVPKTILNREVKHKTKGILWMVSHCSTDSKREDYVKKLQSHLKTLNIDILGQCGKDILPKDNTIGESFGRTTNLLNIMQGYSS